MKNFKVFVINPGSTSTKLSYFENEKNLFTTDVFHDSSVLRQFPTINDQLDYRMQVIEDFLKKHNIDLTGVDAIVGRGGGCYPIEGGVYEIDDTLIDDTRNNKGGLYHASMLGVQMAEKMREIHGGRMFMMDPPILDEMCGEARLTGVEGIHRHLSTHALNLKATCRVQAEKLGKRYEDCNFIAAHIDGGISVTAHLKGRMIDGNDGGGGEGPFTPTRMGSMAITDVNMYLHDKSLEEMKDLCSQAGGFSSYFGTSNSNKVHKLVEEGDPKATAVWNACIYQVCKWIGMMAPVLKGDIDGIVLTGGLLRFQDVIDQIKDRCGWIAPISVYPGEMEQEAMAYGALRVLKGEEQAKVYPGKPAWDGFDWEKNIS